MNLLKNLFLSKKITNTALRIGSGVLKFLFHLLIAQILGLELYGEFINKFSILNILILILGFEIYTVISHKISKQEWALIDALKHEILYLLIIIPLLLLIDKSLDFVNTYILLWIGSEIIIRNLLRYLVADDKQISSSLFTFIQSLIILALCVLYLKRVNIWLLLFYTNIIILVILVPTYVLISQTGKFNVTFQNMFNFSTIKDSFKMSIVGATNRVVLYADRIFLIKHLPPDVFGQIAFLGSLLSSLNLIIDPLIYQIRLPQYIKGNMETLRKDFLGIITIVIAGTFGSLLIFMIKFGNLENTILIGAIMAIYICVFLNNFFQFILYTQGRFNELLKSSLPIILLVLSFLPFVNLLITVILIISTITLSLYLKYVYTKNYKVFL